MQTHKERVQEAIDNENWQEFRQDLKGRSTEEKIRLLHSYYDEGHWHWTGGCDSQECPLGVLDDNEWLNYQIRVDNYIKALCRGGQLFKGESLQSMIACNWKPTIKS